MLEQAEEHKRGYKPFETIVHLRATVTGSISEE